MDSQDARGAIADESGRAAESRTATEDWSGRRACDEDVEVAKTLEERRIELAAHVETAQRELAEINQLQREIARREDEERAVHLGRLIVATRDSNRPRYEALVAELEPVLKRAAARRLFGFEPLKGAAGENGESH